MHLMVNKKILMAVRPWAETIGTTKAMKRLTDRGLGLSTADKMIHGRYSSKPSDRTVQILVEEMEKDGVKFAA